MGKLTAKRVEHEKRKGLHNDGNGLYLKVTDKSTKSWVFRYKFLGKPRNMGLGTVKIVSLANARDKAIEARKLIIEGIDPIEARKEIIRATAAEKAKKTTFKECSLQYIDENKASWKNKKHIQQWYNTLKNYVFPLIGDLHIQDIDTNLILKVLKPVWQEKTETASRLRGRIETIIDYAKVQGAYEGENPARWKGHLSNVLPAPAKIKKVKHHSALPYAQMYNFMYDLKPIEGIAAKCLYVIALIGARQGEVRKMRWEEIDFKHKTWTAPASTMKMKKEHIFPLSTQVIKILKTVTRFDNCDYVFPSPSSKSGILSENAFKKILDETCAANYTVHGFRSSFRDWAAEQTAFPSVELELCLAHNISSDVETSYRRSDLLEKRRNIMQTWADYCFTPPITEASNNVVKIGAL